MKSLAISASVVLVAGVAVAGWWYVGADDRAWHRAVAASGAVELHNYQQQYPTGKHASEAAAEIDDRKWQETQSAGAESGTKALGTYLKEFPQGKHYAEAMAKMEELDWAVADRQSTPEAYFAFHKKYAKTEHLKFSSGKVTAGIIFLFSSGGGGGFGCEVFVDDKKVGIVGGEDAKRLGIAEGEGAGTIKVKTLPNADVVTRKIGENWCVVGVQSSKPVKG